MLNTVNAAPICKCTLKTAILNEYHSFIEWILSIFNFTKPKPIPTDLTNMSKYIIRINNYSEINHPQQR